MAAYHHLERKVARALESLPRVRSWIKALYHGANYMSFRHHGFRWEIHPSTQLLTAGEWAGVALEPEGGVFFGYYDKSPWSPDMRQAIVHRIRSDGRVAIMVLNRQDHTSWVAGVSSAWNHQQGTMAQWLPWSAGSSLIFNDFREGRLVSRILTGGEELLIPFPIQSVHPVQRLALSLNYRRLARLRPEYGYAVDATNFTPDQPLDRDGVWEINLSSGDSRLVISLASLVDHAPSTAMVDSEHKINHVMYSPGGSRIVFLHRWLGSSGRFSRLYVADADGTNLRLLLDERMVSHYSWADETHVIVWARTRHDGDHYYLLDVDTGQAKIIGPATLDVYGDGHISWSPDRQWIVTDSYPDRARVQHLLLYRVASGQRIQLGRFLAPWHFTGAIRCDLHPRWSPDGRWISVDSAHTGTRMTYMLDVSTLVTEAAADTSDRCSSANRDGLVQQA